MIGVLKRALERRETIQIMYLDRKGNLSHRYVTVHALNDKYAICYCHYKKERRMFKLENILSALPLYRKKSV